ncbi:hypothetical protein ACWDR7_05155 [Microbacterium sp. NPDC003461]
MDAMMMDAMAKDMKSMPEMASMDMSVMQACMDACSAAEQATTICSTQMMDCAPTCMNCADMCHTTMRSMMRMQGMTPAAMMRMLDACIAMCEACVDACRPHTDSEICQMCIKACEACRDACAAMKDSMMAAA